MSVFSKESILQAIALSSSPGTHDRQFYFHTLDDFQRAPSAAVLPLCVQWLHAPMILYNNNNNNNAQQQQDITTATKLFALACVQAFVTREYANCSESDRMQLRASVWTAAQMAALGNHERIFVRKLAAVLESLVVRDFPQRWTTFTTDIFTPVQQLPDGSYSGGLWYDPSTSRPHVGVSLVMQCFKLVAEDCTDSDFNAKISTKRRSDILIGLHEVSQHFLPHFFQLLERYYPQLTQSRVTLYHMHLYMRVHGSSSMTSDESRAYQREQELVQDLSRLLSETIATLETFCCSMPMVWMTDSIDFVGAMMHLMRERSTQVRAVECLESLSARGKLTYHQWMRWVRDLPGAAQEANAAHHVYMEQRQTEQVTVGTEDSLALQLDFHKALSRMLSTVLGSHLVHITTNAKKLEKGGADFDAIQTYLRLLTELLRHPSGRVCTEQINMWTALLRDPQIVKTRLAEPFLQDVMTSVMEHIVRFRWEDVEEQIHPHWQVLEASFDDEDDKDAFMGELRSKSSLLLKLIGNTEPHIAARVLNARVQLLLSRHGNGEPLDHLEPSNNQLSDVSDASLQFEGLIQPLDNTMSGIPAWALQDGQQSDRRRAASRAETRAAFTEMARTLVSWSPVHLWLKFRRASMIEALKYFWMYDPSTLLPAIESLLRNLGLSDEWNPTAGPRAKMSGQIIGLKKRSGVTLVALAKKVPHHLVPWLAQLSEATRSLLTSEGLIPMNQMHLYEFLSCVATAVDDPVARSNFIGDVLSDAIQTLESAQVQQNFGSIEALLQAFGITQARDQPDFVTNPENVRNVTNMYNKMFTALNRLLSVGRRCSEAARLRPNTPSGGLQTNLESALPPSLYTLSEQLNFPDEGPVSIQELAIKDPFVTLWPRILPVLLRIYDAVLSAWRPEHQAILLSNQFQRYAYAISDDEAYMAKNQDNKDGGVFGEGGTAGSVVGGADRRDTNLVPKWSGWFNELRNTCFQMFGLLAGQRVMFAPEIADMYPQLVAVLVGPQNLQAMEHRHLTQYMKHVLEIMFVSCPSTLYATHLAPIVGPVMEHLRYRLEKTWLNFGNTSAIAIAASKALSSADAQNAATLAAQGGDAWYTWYYSHAGLFTGDLDEVTAEAVAEKYRFDIGRTFSDVVQTALALKGEWALVLANLAKEQQAHKRNDSTILSSGPSTKFNDEGVAVNADGTPKQPDQNESDARKLQRINGLAHFLLLENEQIAGTFCLLVVQSLGYPDAYTCRRITKTCHRILEVTAWSPQYSQLLGQSMFTQAIKNIVTEPKWMVGMEWAMINLVRDIYCRLVLGQVLQPGGQGVGHQQSQCEQNPTIFEQSKTISRPLLGGGILTVPSNFPRQILASLSGITQVAVEQFEQNMRQKRSAKDQKDIIRDLLREAADNLKAQYPSNSGAASGLFDRAIEEESLLHSKKTVSVADLPEKLVTHSQAKKASERRRRNFSNPDMGREFFEQLCENAGLS